MADVVSLRKRDKAALIAELEKAGAEFQGSLIKCPFHDDNHPSAGVYQNDGGEWRFKCQACGLNFSVWDVQARNEGKDTTEVLKAATRQDRGLERQNKTPDRVQGKVFATIEDISAFFEQKIGKVAAVYRYTNPRTRKPDLIVFRLDTVTGKSFRQARPCSGGFELKAPDGLWPIYNRIRVSQADSVVVVEGEKDVQTLNEYGIVATCSPAGASNAAKADWTLLSGKNITVWPDNDKQGFAYQKAVIEILQKLEPAPRIATISPAEIDLQEKEDASDYVEQCKVAGIDPGKALSDSLQRAKPIGIKSDILGRIEDIAEGRYQSIDLPLAQTSKLSNAIIPGTITLLCGSPGASKSLLLLQMMSFWTDAGIKAYVYELEEDRTFHLMRAMAQRAGCSGLTDPKWIERNAERARYYAEEQGDFLELLGRRIWASPETQQTHEQLIRWAEDRAKAGCRIICVDPITAAAQSSKPWIQDNSFLQSMKKIAGDYACSIVLVTHPKQTASSPDMNQLAGGQAFSRFAQTILWLEAHEDKQSTVNTACGRIEETHNRTLHILKARNGRGQGAHIACLFDKNLLLEELGLIIKKK
jgi:5S rRNA maturation endonuclease (ribonuclease M5)